MIFAQTRPPRTSTSSLALSLGFHGALLLTGFLALYAHHVRPVAVESRCCSTTLYWSPNAGISAAKQKARPHRKHRPPLPAPRRKALLAAAPVATPQPPDAQTLRSTPQPASMGVGVSNENAELALPIYRPLPSVPDRSLLPDQEQNIIVEVEISALGDVTGEKLVHGLGNALDQLVLQKAKEWRFRPATLNGTAVASVEDLVFPVSRNDHPQDNPS